jgi:hypothetical protein
MKTILTNYVIHATGSESYVAESSSANAINWTTNRIAPLTFPGFSAACLFAMLHLPLHTWTIQGIPAPPKNVSDTLAASTEPE